MKLGDDLIFVYIVSWYGWEWDWVRWMELYEKSMSLYEYEDGECVRMGDRGENFFS